MAIWLRLRPQHHSSPGTLLHGRRTPCGSEQIHRGSTPEATSPRIPTGQRPRSVHHNGPFRMVPASGGEGLPEHQYVLGSLIGFSSGPYRHPYPLECGPVAHPLNVPIILDIDRDRLNARGNSCSIDANPEALFPLIRRARPLDNGGPVAVDPIDAQHIDVTALHNLAGFAAAETVAGVQKIAVAAPTTIFTCPVLKPHNPALERIAS